MIANLRLLLEKLPLRFDRCVWVYFDCDVGGYSHVWMITERC